MLIPVNQLDRFSSAQVLYKIRKQKVSAMMYSSLHNIRKQLRSDLVIHIHILFQTRIYNEAENSCGPVYITIGDGGNREGLALE